jgi:anti-sigma factor RsiW
LDYPGGRPGAALVYRRAQHVLNLFVWPGEGSGPNEAIRQGYGVIHWSEDGMRHAPGLRPQPRRTGNFVRLWRAGR